MKLGQIQKLLANSANSYEKSRQLMPINVNLHQKVNFGCTVLIAKYFLKAINRQIISLQGYSILAVRILPGDVQFWELGTVAK
jgi:hypothetical protein